MVWIITTVGLIVYTLYVTFLLKRAWVRENERHARDARLKELDPITVTFNNKKFRLSRHLIVAQDCAENLSQLKTLHGIRVAIYSWMKLTDNKTLLRKLDSLCTELEFEIQTAWKFDRDKNYHRYWERPKCECPGMDNRKRWGTAYGIVNLNCPLHGDAKKKKKTTKKRVKKG